MIDKIILPILSLGDLILTWLYIKKYKQWQPWKPTEKMEKNPLLRYLVDWLGIDIGMLIGSILILGVITYISLSSYWVIKLIVGIILILAIRNTLENNKLLDKLIKKYPDGKLPEDMKINEDKNNDR